VSIYPPTRASAKRRRGQPPRRPEDAILYAALDDIRHTLRMGWVDPAIRMVAAQPVFLTAAWSATRPNATKSFAIGAERLRLASLEAVRNVFEPGGHEEYVSGHLSAAERDRLRRTAQAMHCAAPRVVLVLQSWAILARRQRIPGTGLEEPPAKRGVPSWQEGLITVPRSVSPEAEALLDDATIALGVVVTPPALQAVAAWPHYLERAWRDLQPAAGRPEWRSSLLALRKIAHEGLHGLPHPMDLQWDVLERRGLPNDSRRPLAEQLTGLAAAMPTALFVASYLVHALGATDIPGDW
jgi:hypothetical protein